MKVKQLTVVNIGIIEKETIVFEKPLNLFFGEIRSGKTTLAINSIKLLFGGSFSNDLLRHGTDAGYVELLFEDAAMSRKFYRSKGEGTVKAYQIEFYRDNRKVPKPVDAIRELINPFLLDQEFLTKKSAIEKERYFIELFDIDTTEIDALIKEKFDDSKELRSTIKLYGEIEVTPVEKPDTKTLINQRNVIADKNKKTNKEYGEQCTKEDRRVLKYNSDADKHNQIIDVKKETVKGSFVKQQKIAAQIYELTQEGKLLCNQIDEDQMWLDDPKNAKKEPMEPEKIEEPEFESTEEIDEKISNAKVDELKYTQYQQALTKSEEKEYHTKLLAENERSLIALKIQKRQQLSEIASNGGIKSISFNADGGIMYQHTAMDMLSTSQMMKLTSECAGLYPSEIGIELVDKGESLGTSIYEYLGKAKENNSTILATIVSEGPAKNIPEDVGVFVVSDGKVKQSE